MAKKDSSKKQPPSLFDNMDLFEGMNIDGAAGEDTAEERPGADAADGGTDASAQDEGADAAPGNAGADKNPEGAGKGRRDAKRAGAETPAFDTVKAGLTGHGPMKDLFDFNFRQYSAYVICSRAIPAVEDGLKPVQRRIMHALYEQDDGRYTKVANIVGQTMQYHPHGDASIGDAIVVLANKLWGKGKGYLIDGQGNYGSLLTGMPHAAVRYIECRLTELAKNEVFNRKTTEYVPNYDGRKQEPVYLPAKIPLLLMLGADGIAVGLSTAILPHNFIELLEAEICLIQKKPFTLYPDFQLGGIMDVSEYQEGLGKVKVRARIAKEDKNKLVITELPWGETTDSIAASIEEAIKKKKVPVRKLHDLTSDTVKIELELATGESQEKAITALYAFTTCEKSLSSRPIVLDGGRPKMMTVPQILQKNVDRLMALTKREQEIRLGELDDLFHARTLDRIFIEERIYKRIETEKTMEGVKGTIRTGFKPFMKQLRRSEITDDDIERLLKLQIRRISQFDIDKNRQEIEAIKKEEAQVKDNLVHLRAFVVKYLKGLIKQYKANYPRCTEIVQGAFKQVDVRKLTSSELTVRWDKENHFVGSGIRGGDELFKCSSLDKLILVWKDGRYRMCPPEEKIFVDKDLAEVILFNPEKDREKEYTCIYEDGLYGFSYVKFFSFGGMINNKEYRLAPEKSKVVLFMQGAPEAIWVKYRPAKNQRVHQQMFDLKEYYKSKKTGDDGKPKPLPGAAYNGNRGKQVTMKGISRVAVSQPSWWDASEDSPQGVLL